MADAVRDAAAGRSRMVVLVGNSSTGKTRACWEAIQPLAAMGWRLWHPFHPTRAEAALEELHRVGPRTVVWLNEAQHYLGAPRAGERIAAAIHALLIQPDCGPVLVLGTLWPEYAQEYAALPEPGGEDPHSRARELLSGRTLRLPDAFDARALAVAAGFAEDGDRLLADALSRARADGRLTQDLAGGPALLERYRTGSPAARALLEAAMDARRLGVGLHLPMAFLTDAVSDYLHSSDYDDLSDDWAERAYAELAKQVHGKQVPLRRAVPRPQRRPPSPATPIVAPSSQLAGPVFRLADYLEQHGRASRRHLCPPDSFWHAAVTHLTNADDLDNLAQAAEVRYRLQWAHYLRSRADRVSPSARYRLAVRRERAGERDAAEALAVRAADQGDTGVLVRLAVEREVAGDRPGAEVLLRQAADYGNTDVLYRLAEFREWAGDQDGAEAHLRQAASHGSIDALVRMAERRAEAGDRDGAEALVWQAADRSGNIALQRLSVVLLLVGNRDGAETLAHKVAERGSIGALVRLAILRAEAGDREGAEAFYQQAADRGRIDALVSIAELREKTGDRDGAEAHLRQAADRGSITALARLAELRAEAGDWEGARALALEIADHDHFEAFFPPAFMRWQYWDRIEAEELYQRAAERGSIDALVRLAELRARAGNWDGAEANLRQAASHGSIGALVRLAELRAEAGDWDGAGALYQQAADEGSTEALVRLITWRERAGDWEGAKTVARRAVDHGFVIHSTLAEIFKRMWPFGLDPDGMPTPRWQ